MAEPEIYTSAGERRDLAWLQTVYGAHYVPTAAAELAFRLAQVRVTVGPATCTARVQRGDTGLANHAVAFSWPSGPVDLPGSDFRTIYRPRAAVQWTDSAGYTGFGLGTGGYIADGAGPHACWVLHDQHESDVLDGIGMLPGTEHEGPLHLVFVLADGGAELPLAEKLTYVRNRAWNSLYPAGGIAYNPEAALARQARTWDMGVPVTAEGRSLGLAWQGFADGILWCVDGDWGHMQVLEW